MSDGEGLRAPEFRSPQRLERSAALERFERLERAAVLAQRLNDLNS